MKFNRFKMTEDKLYNLVSIKEMLGDDEVVKYMIKVFVDSTPETLDELNQGYNENNPDKLARSAHKMKASLDLLKIDQLFEVVRKIDKKEKVEKINKGDLEKIILEMNSVLNIVFAQLNQEISSDL